jgi:hypothetical protein
MPTSVVRRTRPNAGLSRTPILVVKIVFRIVESRIPPTS